MVVFTKLHCGLNHWNLGPDVIIISWFFLMISHPLKCQGSETKGERKVSITESNLNRKHYSGELVFADEFDTLDLETWFHDNTLGGATWPFHMYTNSRRISYAKNGTLFIKPTLTSEVFGVDYLYTGQWAIQGAYPVEMCTDHNNYGCKRSGHIPDLVNPVISAQIRTVESFYFKYGRVVVRAKLPAGDWMWPAIVMQPRFNSYGGWPASGDVRIVESRGNQLFFDRWKNNLGSERITSTLHFGPNFQYNRYEATTWYRQSPPGKGFDRDFHLYELVWDDKHMRFTVDGDEILLVTPGAGGFWDYGNFSYLGVANPWKYPTNLRMAPFDQKFYLSMNVAVGGDQYFPDDFTNGKGKKPWDNKCRYAYLNFFDARNDWFPTWQGDDGAMQVDYIRVYAI